MSTIRLAGHDLAWACAPGDTVLRSALRAGVGMSYSCNTGSCGNCRFELLEGEVAHLRADPPAWTDKDRARNRWLGCQATPLSDCTVRFRPDPAAALPVRPALRDGTLLSVAPLSHDISEFAFRVTGDPSFRPGQYALLALPGVEGARVYSMSNLPGTDAWSFIIRRVPGGAATTALFDRLAPGDTVLLDGPYGLAYLRDDSPRDLLLIAGGSGLSPMVSIARAALGHPSRRIRAYFGGRGPRDLDAASVLATLAPDRLDLVTAVSDPQEGWAGRQGFVHEVACADLGDRLHDHDIYFAGPAAMAQAIQAAMHQRGVPRDRIFFDEFY